MKYLMAIAALTALLFPASAQAQRFPYHASVFFHDCAHLHDARHNEPSDDLVNDISCARYIEGFEVAFIDAKHLPQTCLADPMSLFDDADLEFQKDPQPDVMPTRYLSAAILARCKQ